MNNAEVPELRVEDFQAGLELVDESTRHQIMEHVHGAAIKRVLQTAESARQSVVARAATQMDKDWS
ncbi:hypothetical protein BH09PAT4_BH09PAT4_08110 [soil metagenome]